MLSRIISSATRLRWKKILPLLAFVFIKGYCFASACETNAEEQAIYSTILRLPNEFGNVIPIVDPTTENFPIDLEQYLQRDLYQSLNSRLLSARPGETIILSSPGKEFVPLPRNIRLELQNQFDSHLKEPCQISSIGNGFRHLESSAIIKQLFSNGRLNSQWQAFHQTFGPNAALFRFSRIAFDATKGYAIVHVSAGSDEMIGSGELYLLKKTGDNWTVQRKWLTWTT